MAEFFGYVTVCGLEFSYYNSDGVLQFTEFAEDERDGLDLECQLFDRVIRRLSDGRKIEVFDVPTEKGIWGSEGKITYSLCNACDKVKEKAQ